ncbi:MAG TPA: RHS repeat-associated core domain-containing protein [Phycisphaerae bacterium]|nr:RHS repeat-associated core domain-containing protein [Phycisphaerae bacterium]HNU45534.1 RHS repeat-associated core domain-containing protein [Phycisphaerae bacterium]
MAAGPLWARRSPRAPAAVGLDPPSWPPADLDGDGDVDLADFALLANSFGMTGGATYTWDAENRLVAVTPAYRAVGGDRKVEFGYDYLGRRVVKRVYAWNGSAWVAPAGECAVRKFAYDGWRVIMELDGLNGDAVLRKYTWGLDLSGSLEGAGGIGGLHGTLDTAGTVATADDRTFIYFYDANGNVGQLVETTADQKFGTIAASYIYTPYGARLNEPGENEYDQPFRFSTKWFDAETGLGYWGERYYRPELGRWISEDPIGQRGDWNVYRYARSRPNQWIDPLGLQAQDPQTEAGPRPADPEPDSGAASRPGEWRDKPDPDTNRQCELRANPAYKRPTDCCERKKNGEDVVSKPGNCFLIVGAAQSLPGHASAGMEGILPGTTTCVGLGGGDVYCFDDYITSPVDKGKGAIYECCCLSDAEFTHLQDQFRQILDSGGKVGDLPGKYDPQHGNQCMEAALRLVGKTGCPDLPASAGLTWDDLEKLAKKYGTGFAAWHIQSLVKNNKYCGIKAYIDDPYYSSRVMPKK